MIDPLTISLIFLLAFVIVVMIDYLHRSKVAYHNLLDRGIIKRDEKGKPILTKEVLEEFNKERKKISYK